MDPKLLRELTLALETEQARLEGELSSFAARDPKVRGDWHARFPPRSPHEASSSHSAQDEQADLEEEFATELAQEQSLESRLAEVGRALERIGKNEYGRCRACAQPIPEMRLRANPAADYDIAHQPQA